MQSSRMAMDLDIVIGLEIDSDSCSRPNGEGLLTGKEADGNGKARNEGGFTREEKLQLCGWFDSIGKRGMTGGSTLALCPGSRGVRTVVRDDLLGRAVHFVEVDPEEGSASAVETECTVWRGSHSVEPGPSCSEASELASSGDDSFDGG